MHAVTTEHVDDVDQALAQVPIPVAVFVRAVAELVLRDVADALEEQGL